MEKEAHPDQLDMCEILEKPMTNAERQKKWRETQKALGRSSMTLQVTEEERFYIERLVLELRKTGGTPAMMRNKKGQLYPLDIKEGK